MFVCQFYPGVLANRVFQVTQRASDVLGSLFHELRTDGTPNRILLLEMRHLRQALGALALGLLPVEAGKLGGVPRKREAVSIEEKSVVVAMHFV